MRTHECYEHAPVLQTNKDLTDDLEALDPISLYFTLNVLNINNIGGLFLFSHYA